MSTTKSKPAKKLCPSALIIAGGVEAQFNYQETISMMYFKFTKQIIEDIKFEVASDGLVTTDLSIGYNGWRSYGSISKLFN